MTFIFKINEAIKASNIIIIEKIGSFFAEDEQIEKTASAITAAAPI